jgi:MFS family permease
MIESVGSLRRVFLVATFLRWLGPGLMIPVMVLVLTSRGLGIGDVGVVFAVYGATTVLLELPTGGLADALGRRPVLVAAAALFMGLDVALVVGTTLPAFAVGAFVGGVGRALSSGPLESWFVDRVRVLEPGIVLRSDLSRAGMLEGVALTLGALASAGLAAVGAGRFGGLPVVLIPVLAAIAADALFLVTVLITIREPGHTSDGLGAAFAAVPGAIRDGLRIARSATVIRLLLGSTVAIALGAVTIEVMWQPRLADLVGGPGAAAKIAGLVVAAFALASVVGSALAQRLPARLADRPGPAAGVAVGIAALGLVGMALSHAAWPLVIAMFCTYGALSVSSVLRQEMLHEWVPAERRATMVSVDSLAGQLGNVVASLVVARIAGVIGIPGGWLIGAGALVVGAGIVTYTRMPQPAPETGVRSATTA